MTDDPRRASAVVRFSLDPPPPFRLDLTAWALRRQPANIVDRYEGGVYRRVVVVDGLPIALAVRQVGTSAAPRLDVEANGDLDEQPLALAGSAVLDRLLGLSVDLDGFHRFAASDPDLGPLVEPLLGIRPPRYPSAFEALVNAVTCQQITLALGIRMLNRLAKARGPSVGDAHAFPRPEDLAGADPGELRALGLSAQKARTISEAARLVVAGDLDLEGLAALDDDLVISKLTALRGVGWWTAEYVLLRGLGRTHVYPGDDSGLRRGLSSWLNAPTLDQAGTRKLLDRWFPYAGLVYLCLLASRLVAAGHVLA